MAEPPSIVGDEFPDSEATSVHLSFGALLVIVIFGTMIAFGVLASFCLWFTRHRTARLPWQQDAIVHGTNGTTGGPDSYTRRQRRLSKRPSVKTCSSSTTREVSPVRHTTPPVIPPLPFRNRSSLFGGKWLVDPKNPNRVTWVDEDVLHEPRGNDEKVPKSWSLKNLIPALPRWNTTHCELDPELGLDHSEAQPRPSRSPTRDVSPARQVPSRSLPQPPRPVATHDPHLRLPSAPGFVYGLPTVEEMRRQRQKPAFCISPNGSIIVPPHHSRPLSDWTDSTLSEILKSTERRLQEGSIVGSHRRDRSISSLSKTPKSSRDTLVAKSDLATDSSTLCQSRPSSGSSSPIKISFGSQAPVQSHYQAIPDPYPKVANSSDEPNSSSSPTSDSRNHNKSVKLPELERLRSKSGSPCSSVSSALSTLYSEDETPDAAAKSAPMNRIFLAPVSYQPPSNHCSSVLPSPAKKAPSGHVNRNINRGRVPPKLAGPAKSRSVQFSPGTKGVGDKPQPSIRPGQSLRIVDSPSALNLYADLRAAGTYQLRVPGGFPSSPANPLIVSRPPSRSGGVPSGTASTTSRHTSNHGRYPNQPSFAVSSPSNGSAAPPPASSGLSLSRNQWRHERSPSCTLPPVQELRPQASSPTLGHGQQDIVASREDGGIPHSDSLLPAPLVTNRNAAHHSHSSSIDSFSTARQEQEKQDPKQSQTPGQKLGQNQNQDRQKETQQQQKQQQTSGSSPQHRAIQALVSSASNSSSVYSQDGEAVPGLPVSPHGSPGPQVGTHNTATGVTKSPAQPRRSHSLDSGRLAVLRPSDSASSIGISRNSYGGRDQSRTPSFGLAAAVAQLRRMNSAASVDSFDTGEASRSGGHQQPQKQQQQQRQYSQNSQNQPRRLRPNYPKLPVLRGGEFGASGRRTRSGIQNYLALEAQANKSRCPRAGLVQEAGQWSTVNVHKIGVEQGPTTPASTAAGTNLGARVESGRETKKTSTGRTRVSKQQQPDRNVSRSSSSNKEGKVGVGQARRQLKLGLREGSNSNRGTPPPPPPSPTKSITNIFLEKQGLGATQERPLSQESLGLYDREGFLISTPSIKETSRGRGLRG